MSIKDSRKHNLISVFYLFYMVFLTYPLLLGTSYADFLNPPPFIYYMQIFGVISFLLVIMLTQGRAILGKITSNKANRYKFIFIIFTFISIFSLFSEEILLSFAYSISTLLIFLASGTIWFLPKDKIKKTFLIYSMLLILLYLSAILIRGVDPFSGRMVGMIHPNFMGLIAFCSLGAFCLAKQSWRVPMMIIAFIICLSVSSRIGMITIFIFSFTILMGSFLKNINKNKLLIFFSTTTLIFFVLYLMILLGKDYILTDFIISSLKLDSIERGLGSGFTGRFDLWSSGLSRILEKPFIGYGFRSSKILQAHNGYINLLTDIGIILGALLIGFSFYAIIISGFNFLKSKNPVESDKYLVTFAILLGYSISWFFEPAHFYIGLFYSVLYMTILMSPYIAINIRRNYQ